MAARELLLALVRSGVLQDERVTGDDPDHDADGSPPVTSPP